MSKEFDEKLRKVRKLVGKYQIFINFRPFKTFRFKRLRPTKGWLKLSKPKRLWNRFEGLILTIIYGLLQNVKVSEIAINEVSKLPQDKNVYHVIGRVFVFRKHDEEIADQNKDIEQYKQKISDIVSLKIKP